MTKGTSLVKNLHKGEKYVHRKYIAFELTLDVDADVVNDMNWKGGKARDVDNLNLPWGITEQSR